MEKVIKLNDLKNLKGKDRIVQEVMTMIDKEQLKVYEIDMDGEEDE